MPKANKMGGSMPGKQTTPTKKGAGPTAKKRSANGGGDQGSQPRRAVKLKELFQYMVTSPNLMFNVAQHDEIQIPVLNNIVKSKVQNCTTW